MPALPGIFIVSGRRLNQHWWPRSILDFGERAFRLASDEPVSNAGNITFDGSLHKNAGAITRSLFRLGPFDWSFKLSAPGAAAIELYCIARAVSRSTATATGADPRRQNLQGRWNVFQRSPPFFHPFHLV